MPTDIEKIRTTCGIGHWNTALNYCLELMLEGRINGRQTSKGWIFWVHSEKQLQPWEEAIGTYKDLKINQQNVVLTLTTLKTLNLTFPKDSLETQILIQTLEKVPKGAKLALLKTDNPEKPLIIRTFNETTAAIPIVMEKEQQKTRNFTKTTHNREDPKNKHKKQAPTTNLDRRWLWSILGSFWMF